MSGQERRISIAADVFVSGHEGALRRAEFAPDGQHFAVGDSAGRVAVYSLAGGIVASSQSVRGKYGPPSISSVRWSPDGKLIATMEQYVLRLRRADDLSVVAEVDDISVGPIAFVGSDRFVIAPGRELSVRTLPTLAEIATVPIERRHLQEFYVSGLAADPRTGVVVTCDPGGRDSDENDHTTDRDSPQLTFIDAVRGDVQCVIDSGVLNTHVQFDPWRNTFYAHSFARGTGIWTPVGTLVAHWKPYESRRRPNSDYVPLAQHFAMSARVIFTMPSMSAATERTIDAWDPETRAHLGSSKLPDGEMPNWIAASHDGAMLLIPRSDPERPAARHGFRIWRVTETTAAVERASPVAQAPPAAAHVQTPRPPDAPRATASAIPTPNRGNVKTIGRDFPLAIEVTDFGRFAGEIAAVLGVDPRTLNTDANATVTLGEPNTGDAAEYTTWAYVDGLAGTKLEGTRPYNHHFRGFELTGDIERIGPVLQAMATALTERLSRHTSVVTHRHLLPEDWNERARAAQPGDVLFADDDWIRVHTPGGLFGVQLTTRYTSGGLALVPIGPLPHVVGKTIITRGAARGARTAPTLFGIGELGQHVCDVTLGTPEAQEELVVADVIEVGWKRRFRSGQRIFLEREEERLDRITKERELRIFHDQGDPWAVVIDLETRNSDGHAKAIIVGADAERAAVTARVEHVLDAAGFTRPI